MLNKNLINATTRISDSIRHSTSHRILGSVSILGAIRIHLPPILGHMQLAWIRFSQATSRFLAQNAPCKKLLKKLRTVKKSTRKLFMCSPRSLSRRRRQKVSCTKWRQQHLRKLISPKNCIHNQSAIYIRRWHRLQIDPVSNLLQQESQLPKLLSLGRRRAQS